MVPSCQVEPVSEISCRLQDAIQHGDTNTAASLATQLASQRAALSIEKSQHENNIENEVRVRIHVEDRDTDAGNLVMTVLPSMSIRLLKQKIFACLGFPPEVQNWIVGRHLAVDDNILNDLAEIDTGLILYLYLMPARAVGLTRKAYQEKYIPSFAEQATRELPALPPECNASPAIRQHHDRVDMTVASQLLTQQPPPQQPPSPQQPPTSPQQQSHPDPSLLASRPLPPTPLQTPILSQMIPAPHWLPGQQSHPGQQLHPGQPPYPAQPYPAQLQPGQHYPGQQLRQTQPFPGQRCLPLFVTQTPAPIVRMTPVPHIRPLQSANPSMYQGSWYDGSKPLSWSCTRCTFSENKANNVKCEMCEADRPQIYV